MLITSTTKTIALCSLSNLINAADRAIMPIAILQMAPEFKWNMHDQGWILSAFPLGYFSSQVGKKNKCLMKFIFNFNLIGNFTSLN